MLPHERANDSHEELEEERRLFFVGVTRAKTNLYVSYAQYRTFRGQLLRTIPSQFLYELGPGLMHEPPESDERLAANAGCRRLRRSQPAAAEPSGPLLPRASSSGTRPSASAASRSSWTGRQQRRHDHLQQWTDQIPAATIRRPYKDVGRRCRLESTIEGRWPCPDKSIAGNSCRSTAGSAVYFAGAGVFAGRRTGRGLEAHQSRLPQEQGQGRPALHGDKGGLWPKPQAELQDEIRLYGKPSSPSSATRWRTWISRSMRSSPRPTRSAGSRPRLQDVDGILVIHLSMGIGGILNGDPQRRQADGRLCHPVLGS